MYLQGKSFAEGGGKRSEAIPVREDTNRANGEASTGSAPHSGINADIKLVNDPAVEVVAGCFDYDFVKAGMVYFNDGLLTGNGNSSF